MRSGYVLPNCGYYTESVAEMQIGLSLQGFVRLAFGDGSHTEIPQSGSSPAASAAFNSALNAPQSNQVSGLAR